MDEEIEQMFGANNVADMMLSRGAGEFDLDYTDEAVRTRMAATFICNKHKKELYSQWNMDKKHFIHKGTGKKKMCSIPNDLVSIHTSDDGKRNPATRQYLQKKEAIALLQQTGVLLHIGIRKKLLFIFHEVFLSALCQAHAEYLGDIVTEECVVSMVQPRNHNLKNERHRAEGITDEIETAFERFAHAVGVNIPFQRKPFNTCKIDTQRRKGTSVRKMRKTMYKIVAPDYEDELEKLDLFHDSTYVWSSKHTEKLTEIMEAFADSYHSATTSEERKAILSIVAPVLSYNEIVQVNIFKFFYKPNLT
jgi:hypothetical protein